MGIPAIAPATLSRLAGLALCLWLAGCATPIGATRVDPQRVHRTLNANVLSTGELSAPTENLLHRLDLADAYAEHPRAAFERLRELAAVAYGRNNRSYALSELAFQIAEADGDRGYYLASAAYAYAFLFPEDGDPPNPYDPRFRTACDLYNRGLAEGLTGADGKVALESGTYRLPFGELVLTVDPDGLTWGGYRLGDFVPAADFQVRGLKNRYRRAGIGAPLAAAVEPVDPMGVATAQWIPAGMMVPITAFLSFHDVQQGLLDGRLTGKLEVFAEYQAPAVAIDGREVPLEYETTVPLAYTLERSTLWDFELRGFLSGDFGRPGKNGLFMLQPYQLGHVPVVLVHGTASSPARWTELVNELLADPVIRDGCQIWLFTYNTGNPIAYSAAELRKALAEAVHELDPDGTDPALRDMVVIGHSQGGLLTKMTVVDGGTKFWDAVSPVPLDDLGVSRETRDLIASVVDVTPVPYVKRVVFIATPHRGSHLALRWVRRVISWVWTAPVALVKAGVDLGNAIARNPDRAALRRVGRLPSSVDNMSPDDPFLVTLGSLPIVEGVTAHSIIAAEGEGRLQDLSDGVVRYDSAHIDGVASELVVRSGHSTQAHPQTILEVRRILHEHLGKDVFPASVPVAPAASER